LIRNAVKDSLVLGCGMPFLASIGVVDNNRISSDTGKSWQAWGLPTVEGQEIDKSQPSDPSAPSLKSALNGTLSRWWQYDRWFRADPDVVMARDENTELTIAESRISSLTAIITGVAFTSDRLDRMGNDRLRLLALSGKVRIRDLKPLDWEDKACSYLFEGSIDNHRAIAIFNYSEYPQKVKLSELNMPADCKELLHPLMEIENTIEVAPHDAALIVEKSYGI
jgi:alpha-galactosidase